MSRALYLKIRHWWQVTDLHKEDEVLEGGVEVRLLAQLHHLGEVLVVDVRVHAEQALQDRLGHRQEVLGERHAWNVTDVSVLAYFKYINFCTLLVNTLVENIEDIKLAFHSVSETLHLFINFDQKQKSNFISSK